MTRLGLHTSPTDTAMRRLAHLLQVQKARAAELQAQRNMAQARASAKAGGCSDSEISAAVQLIERAARA